MRTTSEGAALALLTFALACDAAGRAEAGPLLTFDDMPDQRQPADLLYDGYTFHQPDFQITRANGAGASNGTISLIFSYSDETISRTDSAPFSRTSLDIGLSYYTRPAEATTLTLNFVGGGSATIPLALTQSYQHVAVDATNLRSFAIAGVPSLGYIAIDNLDLTAAPEPSTLAGAGLAGAVGLVAMRRWRKAVVACAAMTTRVVTKRVRPTLAIQGGPP